MRIARQIGQYRFGSCERALDVDDPLDLAQRCQPLSEGRRITEGSELAMELQLAAAMGRGQFFKEAPAEQAREHAHGQEEAGSAGDPAIGIEGETAAGHDAVHVGVVSEG